MCNTGVLGFDFAPTIEYATRGTTYRPRKNGRQNINADYDVVAEAEAILANAVLVNA